MRHAFVLASCVGLFAGLSPASSQRVVAVQPGPIVWIEGGWFNRGTSAAEMEAALRLCTRVHASARRCAPGVYAQESPRRRVYVSRFGIDRFEVTNAAWRACVRAGECAPNRAPEDERVGAPQMPVTGVNWDEAQGYCDGQGGRLPTETEWERAARGPSSRVFPWGRLYNDRLANHGGAEGEDPIDGFTHAAPVGSFPSGVSVDGVHDLAGNVWEWTADAVDGENTAWATELRVDPRGAESGGSRIVRGGSWRSPPDLMRAATRIPVPAGLDQPDLGFRCAYDGR